MASIPSKSPLLLSRFKGCLTGAVAGDCLGAYFEMRSGVEVEAVVESFSEVKKNSKKVHHFTDDTAMARSVAESLVKCRGLNTTDMAHRFVSEYFKDPGKGYGGNVGAVFKKLKRRGFSDPHGPASEQFGGQGSYGNGGAMRIAPAALYGYHLPEAELNKLAEDITRITHSHRDAIRGAILQCAAVQLALQEPQQDMTPINTNIMIDTLHERMQKLEAQDSEHDVPPRRAKRKSEEEPMPYCYKLQKMKELLDKDAKRTEVVDILGNDISALGAAPAALYSFLRCTTLVEDIKTDNPLERTIMYAVSLGGDTDTIATMAGAIAGAYYGLERVPKHWLSFCEGMTDAQKQAHELWDLVQNTEFKK